MLLIEQRIERGLRHACAQPGHQQDARLLRIEITRKDGAGPEQGNTAAAVCVDRPHFTVRHTTGNHHRNPHAEGAQDALEERVIDIARAHGRDYQAARAGRQRGLERKIVHAGIHRNNIHTRQAWAAADACAATRRRCNARAPP